MENYTIVQWFAFFIIYCFFGWCIESTIVSVTKRKIVNRGLLRGPILPLYGSGGTVMLLSTIWVQDNVLLVYIFGTIGATILEYITGVAMESLFKIKYWDYSDKLLNFKGYICIKSSLFWGVLTVFLVYIVHPNVSRVVLMLDPVVLTTVLAFVLVACIIDTTIAFKNAIDLQKFLVYQTKIRAELSELTQRVGELKNTIVGKENAGIMDVLKSQEERIDKLHAEMENAKSKIGNLKKSILRSFPTATSASFSEALEDVKQLIKGR